MYRLCSRGSNSVNATTQQAECPVIMCPDSVSNQYDSSHDGNLRALSPALSPVKDVWVRISAEEILSSFHRLYHENSPQGKSGLTSAVLEVKAETCLRIAGANR